MSFPRYAKYKDSGVEWLGKVPAHWAVSPLKHLVKFRSGGTPSKANEQFWDGPVPWVSAKDMKLEVLDDSEDHISEHAVESGAAELLQPGSVLVVVRGMILARTFPVAVTSRAVAFNQDLKALLPSQRLNSFYLAQYLRGTSEESLNRLDEAGHGTKALRMEVWSSLAVTCPSIAEQTAIAAFLDRETGKIDALVAEQEKLIALLKEKRQAVISHAVTKGLDPDARMKPSGIEWLGEVPAHWELGRLADLCDFRSGKAHEPFVDDGGKFVCVNSRFVSTEGASRKYCTENLSPARRGDVLMVMSDLPNGRALAKAFFVDDDGAYAVNQRVCSLTARNGEGRFFFYLLDRNQEFLSYDDGMNQTHLPNSAFEKFKVFAPPADEQRQIAEALTDFCANVAALSDKAERAITLLKERRSALISAAVTGQIDVRAAMSPVGS